MSVFGRLNYNFDSSKFGANNELTDGQKLTLNYPSPLYTWQASDLAGSSVVNYFQNPHSANLTLMTTYTNQLLTYSNTQSVTYNVAPIEANTLNALANNLLIEISSFTDHTNRMSGVTESTNKLTIPDYQIAMSIGRQVLQICNQVDGVQNNAPILGNFTSLAIVSDVSNSVIQLSSSAATLNASLSIVDGNTYSDITRASMNTIIASTQTAFDLLNSRRVGDTTFYTNSISLIQDYNTILQFSNLGVNSSYLIKDLGIGTTKLQNDLQNSVPSGYPNNAYSATTTRSTTSTSTSSSSGSLSVSGVIPGSYTLSNISVDAYGRVVSANSTDLIALLNSIGTANAEILLAYAARDAAEAAAANSANSAADSANSASAAANSASAAANSMIVKVVSITSAATITPTIDTAEQYQVTALATNATIAIPTGTPSNAQRLLLRIKDNGVARSLIWTTSAGGYRAVGVSLPSSTNASKVLYVGCIYNSNDSFWDVIGVAKGT
jgi:hypothetical protein